MPRVGSGARKQSPASRRGQDKGGFYRPRLSRPRFGSCQNRRGASTGSLSEKADVPPRGAGTLRYDFPPNANVQWQPRDLSTPTSGS